MTSILPKARPTTAPTSGADRAATWNSGSSSRDQQNTAPAAPRREQRRRAGTCCSRAVCSAAPARSDLQLKPWNRRLRHSVAKAMVLAVGRAAVGKADVEGGDGSGGNDQRPPITTLVRKVRVRIPSLRGRGFSRITSSVWGSRPRAIAGRLSVSRLINSRCTAAKGTGSARQRGIQHRQDAGGVAGEQELDRALDVGVDDSGRSLPP